MKFGMNFGGILFCISHWSEAGLEVFLHIRGPQTMLSEPGVVVHGFNPSTWGAEGSELGQFMTLSNF